MSRKQPRSYKLILLETIQEATKAKRLRERIEGNKHWRRMQLDYAEWTRAVNEADWRHREALKKEIIRRKYYGTK